jgi:hypothetical protein
MLVTLAERMMTVLGVDQLGMAFTVYGIYIPAAV